MQRTSRAIVSAAGLALTTLVFAACGSDPSCPLRYEADGDQCLCAAPYVEVAGECQLGSIPQPGIGAPDPGMLGQPDDDTMIPIVVASGANHQLMLSIDDGWTWCETMIDESMEGYSNANLLRSVAYANGWFVTGSWSALYRSRNGFEWENVLTGDTPITSQWIAGVAYGNGYWVAVGGYGTAMRSTDLVEWEDMTDQMPGNEASNSIAFGNGVFVASRDDLGWFESVDGTDWKLRDASALYPVAFDGTNFVEKTDYVCRNGSCIRAYWPEGIYRSPEGPDGAYRAIAQTKETITDFEFGQAPWADFAAGGALPATLRSCLEL